MANEIIRPTQLPARADPVASEVVPSDNGSSVAGVTWADGVNAAVPPASQAESEAGAINTKRMTPLTTKQAIDAQVPPKIDAAIAGFRERLIPEGGLASQSLIKSSDSDFDVAWVTSEANTAVSYAPQVLTPVQKSTARSNIGANSKPYVILATGQSNFFRESDLPSGVTWDVPENLNIWNGHQTTPGNGWYKPDNKKMNVVWRFAAEKARDNPGRQVYVIRIAQGGLPISNWLPDPPTVDMFIGSKIATEAALANIGVDSIDLFMWWQGESDAASPLNYVSDFRSVKNRFRTQAWFPSLCPIIVFGIVSPPVSPAVYGDFARYLQACVAEDASVMCYINTSRLDPAFWADTLHLTAEGYAAAGLFAYNQWTSGLSRPAYEEGRFNPILRFGGESSGIVYNSGNTIGSYTRVGRLVSGSMRINLTSKGSSTGAASIVGLPHGAIDPNRPITVSRWLNMSSINSSILGVVYPNGINLYQPGPVNMSALSDANFTNSSDIWISFMYETTSVYK